jgi:hypothetical protein
VPYKSQRPGDVPTLGFQVLDWMSTYLAAPDRSEYEPFVPTREQAQFVVNFYALDPRTGRRRFRRAVLSRSKGWGKSPLLAAIACAEALAPVVPAGWDSKGQPVARPWSELRTPWVQLAAVSEDQTRNAWAPLLEMLREGPAIDAYWGLEPMETFVNLPKGRIEFVTSAATSREGNRPTFCVLDQTEEWKPSNGGVRLAETLRRNLGKTNGASIESPNAYEPGTDSVAEASAEYAMKIREGRARDDGLLLDHREWPPETDMSERDSLLTGLAYAYGDSADIAGGWVDLERIVAEIYDPATNPQDARRYYGNQITHASDAWLSQPEWAACLSIDRPLADRDLVVLGFDGSRKRAEGVTDATALIGCRVIDGHLFEIATWEQPNGVAGRDWQVPAREVDAAVRGAFKRYNVVGMYADPAKWESYIATWEAAFTRHLKVKASRDHPMEWWMTGGRALSTVRALEQFHSAVIDGELTHDGSFTLTRHVLNARRRVSRSGLQIAKDFPESPRKIDAAVAAVLAWQARLDAIAAGLGKTRRAAPARIR